jgi:hypothetical protein
VRTFEVFSRKRKEVICVNVGLFLILAVFILVCHFCTVDDLIKFVRWVQKKVQERRERKYEDEKK